MRVPGPDSRYIMLWHGAWRPVMNIFDAGNIERTDARYAAKAVLWIDPGYWVATLASPADLIERSNRDPAEREWEILD